MKDDAQAQVRIAALERIVKDQEQEIKLLRDTLHDQGNRKQSKTSDSIPTPVPTPTPVDPYSDSPGLDYPPLVPVKVRPSRGKKGDV